MSLITRIEKEKLKQSARMSDGYSPGVSLSQGLVVGGGNESNAGSHGLVIPWMGNPHIKIVVGAD